MDTKDYDPAAPENRMSDAEAMAAPSTGCLDILLIVLPLALMIYSVYLLVQQ